ncbi:MAG: J domain-containing protein [Clostridiales bacterium]|nr:J domain-containing protein [Clostridiales bacterium]
MKDPYKILGIKPGASDAEIKAAYRRLVKKYHPDQYANNPLSSLAEEKLKEINEAYDYLIKNGSNDYQRNGSRQDSNYSGSYGQVDFARVRQHINSGNIAEAERILHATQDRSPEWFFLKGIIDLRKGFYQQGYSNIRTAASMNPANVEYQQTLRDLENTHTQAGRVYRGSNASNTADDICKICACLYTADCCCECLGGDLIRCC